MRTGFDFRNLRILSVGVLLLSVARPCAAGSEATVVSKLSGLTCGKLHEQFVDKDVIATVPGEVPGKTKKVKGKVSHIDPNSKDLMTTVIYKEGGIEYSAAVPLKDVKVLDNSKVSPVFDPRIATLRFSAQFKTPEKPITLAFLKNPIPGKSVEFSAPSGIFGFVRGGLRHPTTDDAVTVVPNAAGDMFAIAQVDGMGGMKNGDVAAHAVVHSVAESINGGKSLDEAFRASSEAIKKRVPEGNENMGVCASGIQVHKDGRVKMEGIGDSRVMQIRGGREQAITQDQSPIKDERYIRELMEYYGWTREEALRHSRSAVSNYINKDGLAKRRDGTIVWPSYVDTTALPGDVFISASDGLWKNLLPEEVLEIASRGGTAREITERLRDAVDYVKVHRKTPQGREQEYQDDDLTIVVYTP